MLHLKYILSILACAFSLSISAQSITAKVIVNGHFFKEVPAEAKKDSKIFMLNTPNGAMAIGILAPNPLSEDALKYEIAVSDVIEGEDLLRRFNDAVHQDSEKAMTIGANNAPLVNVGNIFPPFSAVDINGKTWTNADVKGKVMVLNIWYTGCGPCRSEMPELSTWKDEMSDVMFFSSTYEAPDIARQVLDKVRFNWIPLVNDKQFKKFIGGNGYPLTIVVDKNGKIAAYEYGSSPEQRARLKELISLLRKK